MRWFRTLPNELARGCHEVLNALPEGCVHLATGLSIELGQLFDHSFSDLIASAHAWLLGW